MPQPIYMQVGDRDQIYLSDFVGAMNNFYGLLREVDSTVADRKQGNLRWKVTTLERSPVPLVGVTPLLRRVENDSSRNVERAIIDNVASLTERGERNKFFSDAALNRVERIAKTTPKIGPSVIYINSREPVDLSTRVTVETLNQVQELTKVTYRSFGSLVGNLGSISVRRGKEFRVWDEKTNLPVKCTFDANQEDKAKDLLGKQVIVSGIINGDRNGRPLSVKVEALDPVGIVNDLPTIDEMFGLVPDFTGGLSLREFFEDV